MKRLPEQLWSPTPTECAYLLREFIEAEVRRVELTGRGATGARKREFAARLKKANEAHVLLDILADYVVENDEAIERWDGESDGAE
jgi:hypothetical protein